MNAFHRSVAKIQSPEGGAVLGAGFLVADDLVLTCAHVLGADPPEAVTVSFPQAPGQPPTLARPLPEAWRPREDVAALRLETPPAGLPALLLRTAPGPPGRGLRTFGFPSSAPTDGVGGSALAGDTFLDGDLVLLCLGEANDIARGFSGGPLVDEDGFVVAMVSAHAGRDAYGRGQNQAYATPARVLATLVPGLQLDDLCPYPGLASFTGDQARWFHGRGRAVEDVVACLAERRRVTVLLGPSGSGKSSLLAAGVLPALTDPARGGASSECVLTRAGTDAAAIADRLNRLASRPGLLVIDQFEELLTVDAPTQSAVLDRLVAFVAGDGAGQVLLVMRNDLYHLLDRRCPPLLSALGIVNVSGRLTPADLTDIMCAPARRQGWALDPVLVESLRRDMLDNRSTAPLTDLPALAITLRRIWEQATEPVNDGDNVLTLAHYEQVGRIGTAFASWCDQAYRTLPEDQQATARHMLTSLVRDADPAHSVAAVRRRCTVEDLTRDRPEERAVLAQLVDDRLVVTETDPAGRPVAELAHDSLIDSWPALRTWLDQDREQRPWRDDTIRRARAWRALPPEQRGRHLLDYDDLDEALVRFKQATLPEDVAEEIDAYIAAGVHAREARTRTARNQRRVRGLLVCLTVIGVTAATLLWRRLDAADDQRKQQAREASANRLMARANSLLPTDPITAQIFAAAALQQSPDPAIVNGAQQALVPALPTAKLALQGHTTVASSAVAAFSADGQTLATVGDDKIVRLRDTTTGAERTTLTGLPDLTSMLVFSPGGKTLATVGDDGSTRLWNTSGTGSTDTPAATLVADAFLAGVAFSPDSQTVATASSGTARLWDTATGTLRVSFTGHPAPVRAVAFSPVAGSTFATGDQDGAVRLWDTSATGGTDTPMATLTGHTGAAMALAFSPDGQTLATAGYDDKTVRLWDTTTTGATATPRATLGGFTGPVSAVVFSPDSRTVTTTGADQTVRLWDTTTTGATDIPRATLTGHTGDVLAAAFSPDGKTLATGSFDGTARLWDTAATGIARASTAPLPGAPGGVGAVAFADDQTLTTVSADGSGWVWNVAAGTPTVDLPGNAEWVQALAFTGTGMLATAGDPTVRLRDVTTGDGPVLVEHYGPVAFSRDGRMLAAAAAGELRLWDTSSRESVPLGNDDARLLALAFSATGSTLATGADDGTVRLWNTATREPVVLARGTQPVLAVAFGRDEKTLATFAGDTVRLWETTTGENVIVGEAATNPMLAFSPDGQTLAFAVADGSAVRLWDTTTGKDVTIAEQDEPHSILAFSPDGQTLATADGSAVRLWDTTTRKLAATFTGHTNTVSAVAFSPGGDTLATVSRDSARITPLPHRFLEHLCARASRNLTQAEWTTYFGDRAPYRRQCGQWPSGAGAPPNAPVAEAHVRSRSPGSRSLQ